MIKISSLSVAGNELRTLLQTKIDGLEVGQIKIGYPKDTFEDMGKDVEKVKNHLNLFFYNVSYDGYPADGLNENPFFVRLYCLITAVGAKDGNPSSGENDLRLIGEVMRVLHQHPIISVDGENNGEIAQLQIVPHPLNLDNLNHIWSTQGETAYRLSIAYEMALAPIPLAVAVERSPRVGETGTGVEGDMDQDLLPDSGFGIETSAPAVPKAVVDVSKPDWAPHVCFVYQNACAYTLAFKLGSQTLTNFVPRIWVAADRDASIDLVWEQWKSDSGWQVVSQRKDIFSITQAVHFGVDTMYTGTNGSGVFKRVHSGDTWVQKNVGLTDLNVQFLAIDSGTPTTVYAGTNSGGVFKTEHSGDTWVQKNEGLTDLNVQFLAVDPDSPVTVYAGTKSGGVFKSDNSGDSWVQKNSDLTDLNVQFLTIDPGPPASVYAGTNGGGVFKILDGEEHWEQKKQGMKNLNVQFIAIDPGTPATVYAGTNGGGVFKSVDGGEHWASKKAGLIDLSIQFIAIDPGTPATVYAGTNGAGVFKSVDGGEHWTQKQQGLSDLNIQFLGIDPGTPATVYAGTNGGGVFKSVDGADSWSELGRIPIGLNDDALNIDPDKADSAKTFQESMPDKLSPGQSMLYAVRTAKSMHDGRVTEVRSNPLLVTVYEAGA